MILIYSVPIYIYIRIYAGLCIFVSVTYVYPWYKVIVQHKTFLLRDYARNWDPRKTHLHTHTQTTIYYDYYCYYDIVIMHSLTDSVLLAFSFSSSHSHSHSLSIYLILFVCLSKMRAFFATYIVWVPSVYASNSNIHIIIIYINRLSHTLAHLCYFSERSTIAYPRAARTHARSLAYVGVCHPLPPFSPFQKVTTLYDTYYIVFNKDI